MILGDLSEVIDNSFYHQFMCRIFLTNVDGHYKGVWIVNMEERENVTNHRYWQGTLKSDCGIFCCYQQTIMATDYVLSLELPEFLDDVQNWLHHILKIK